jgi:hypothetical protein
MTMCRGIGAALLAADMKRRRDARYGSNACTIDRRHGPSNLLLDVIAASSSLLDNHREHGD